MNSEEIYNQLQYYNDRLNEQLNGTATVKLTNSQLGNLANKVDNLYMKYQKQLSQEEKYKNDNTIFNIIILGLVFVVIEFIMFIVLYQT